MNIKKAGYDTVIQFGTREDFDTKLKMNGETFDDVVNYTNEYGSSLLIACLVSFKFDLAKEFLARGAEVNRPTREGFNELHCLAGYIRYPGAVEVARILLDKGVSLMAQDKKYGNTALFTLCLEVFKVRSDETMAFLEDCLRVAESFDIPNKRGITVRQIINNDSASEELKRIMEERS